MSLSSTTSDLVGGASPSIVKYVPSFNDLSLAPELLEADREHTLELLRRGVRVRTLYQHTARTKSHVTKKVTT